jgi:catechol 2,3-dioxygenase-like lactoylglutathione lyase family enzyme
MGAPPDIVAFHVGIVVRDLHAVMDRYQRMFALDHWHLREPQPGIPLRIAYGGRAGTGLAFELIEPVPGEPSQWSEFLAQRGEGVQHIGFWTPDLLGALQAAVAEGGTLVFGPFEQRGHTVVQVEMPPGQLPRQLAYIDVGLGTVRFELIGPPTDQGLRQWLQDDYERIIPPAPWEGK